MTLIPVYVSEIAQDRLRGTLGSFLVLSANTGALCMYIAGAFLDYQTTPKCMLLVSTAFVTLFLVFPETPIFLLRNGKMKEAEESLKFLRGFKKSENLSGDGVLEFQKMIKKVDDDARKARASKLSGLRKYSC